MMASRRKRHLSTLVGAVVLLFVAECAGVCEIPSFAHGTWQHRTRGNIVIDNSTLIPYNLTFTSGGITGYPNGTLTCHESSGNKVVLKTGLYSNSANQKFTYYFCFEFREITGGSILPYGLLTKDLNALTGEYTKVVREVNSTITLQMICDLPQAPVSRREILVSTDTSPTFFNCSSELQAKYTNNDASCGDTIQSCEATGAENIAITSKSNCTPPLFYTAGSSVGCLHTETDGNRTYLYVYNSDATVSRSNQTYRITCLALQKMGSTLYLSQSPSPCLSGMTATSNANKTYEFTETEPCVVTTTTSTTTATTEVATTTTTTTTSTTTAATTASTTAATTSEPPSWVIIVAVVAALLLLVLLGIIIYFCCARKRCRSEDKEKMLEEGSSPVNTRTRDGDTISVDSGFDNAALGKAKGTPVQAQQPVVVTLKDSYGVRDPQTPVERAPHRSFIKKRRIIDKDGNVLEDEEFEDVTENERSLEQGRKRRGRRKGRGRKKKTRTRIHRYVNEDGNIVEEEVESDVTDAEGSVTSADSGQGDLDEEIRLAREKRLKPLGYLPPLPLTDNVKTRNEVEAENNPEDPPPDTKEALDLLSKEKILENEEMASASLDEESQQTEEAQKKKKKKHRRESSGDDEHSDSEVDDRSSVDSSDEDVVDHDESDDDVKGTGGGPRDGRKRGRLRRKGHGWWKKVKDKRKLRGRREQELAEPDTGKSSLRGEVPFMEQYRVKKAMQAVLEKEGIWDDPNKKMAEDIFGLDEEDIRSTPKDPETDRTWDTGYETVGPGQDKAKGNLEGIAPPLISIKVHHGDDEDEGDEKPKETQGDPDTSSGLGESEGSRQGTPEHDDHHGRKRPRALPALLKGSRDHVTMEKDSAVDTSRRDSGQSDETVQESAGLLNKLRLLRDRLFGSKPKQENREREPPNGIETSGKYEKNKAIAPSATRLTRRRQRGGILVSTKTRRGGSLDRNAVDNESGYLSEGYRIDNGDDDNPENGPDDESKGSADGSSDRTDHEGDQKSDSLPGNYPGRKTLPPLHHRKGQTHVILVNGISDDGKELDADQGRPNGPSAPRELRPLRAPRRAWGPPGSYTPHTLHPKPSWEGVSHDDRTSEATFNGRGWRTGPLNLQGAFHAKNFQTPEAGAEKWANARRPASRQVTALVTSRTPGPGVNGVNGVNKRPVPWTRSADPHPPPKTSRPSRGTLNNNKLQRLLQELYRDKVFLDHLIQNIDNPSSLSESEARLLAEYGRDYLLEVADFHSQGHPLPQRPATTNLGGVHLPPVPRTPRNTTTLSLGDLRRHETFC